MHKAVPFILPIELLRPRRIAAGSHIKGVLSMHIFHSTNCGLLLWEQNTLLAVDALHEKMDGFSPTPPTLLKRLLQKETPLGGLIFTHLHPDHYDLKELQQVMAVHPAAQVLCPTMTNELTAAGGWYCSQVGDFSVSMIPTVHEGRAYQNVPHMSLLLEAVGQRVFIAGDAALQDSSELTPLLQRVRAQVAFFNVYQIGRSATWHLVHTAGIQKIFIYHLPEQQDDIYSFYLLARQILRHHTQWTPQPQLAGQMAQLL